MPDLACPYTLTTPAGTIVFNDGSTDQFYISNIVGIVGESIRAPIDDIAYGDGSIGHNWWTAGRHMIFEGSFLVLSVMCGPAMVTLWNQMENDLRVALKSIAGLTTDLGSLAWRPLGLTENTLSVRHDVGLETPADQNYLVRNFTFGLFAENPDWTEST